MSLENLEQHVATPLVSARQLRVIAFVQAKRDDARILEWSGCTNGEKVVHLPNRPSQRRR